MAKFSGNVVVLPGFHGGQLAIYENATRFNHVCCGRRWGKTYFLARLAVEHALRGEYVGIFVPAYKFLSEIYREILDRLLPLNPQASKTEGIIRVPTGGKIDFWSTENEACGRGRKYHCVLIDEAAFCKNEAMTAIWERAIFPTLLDYKGRAFVFSTPNGISEDNWFYKISEDPDWRKFQAPTSTNPYMPVDELERIKQTTHPLVWRQEFLAEFISWSGEVFFGIDKLLVDGQPVADDYRIHGSIFACVDTAMKSGQEHDSTAIVYFGKQPGYLYEDRQARIFVLDWHLEQIDGSMLLDFVPSIMKRLDELAIRHNSPVGAKGIFIEDKVSGTVLLQNLAAQGAPAWPIDSKLTQMGKSERALASSPYIASDLVKLTNHAYSKTMNVKGNTRNHLLTQLASFRIGDKEGARRADDLVDSFCYGTIIGVGNTTGF